MRKNLTHALTAAALVLFCAPAFADGPGDGGPDVAAPPVATPAQPAPAPDPVAQPAAAEGRTGIIPLGDALTINVPQGYRFYGEPEARAYLSRNNAAVPPGAIYGMVARAGADITAPDTWATVISYDAIGYVQPETASGLSDASFEADVRAAREQQNRVFEGFATPPAFTAEDPSLVWAERILSPGSQGKDYRYELKELGRHGVAGLTSIGTADQAPEIATAAAEIAGMLSFTEGERHADFQPANDTVSAYSVPGLVTGLAASTEPQAIADPAGGTGQTAFGGLAGWFPWVALGVILLAIAGFLMMRRRRDSEDEA
ncbi:MAG: hypothetical protein DCF16_00215 [Alphaproteobacteria bacterium]|nr:MAG: hypothetical protein DCF16_00215 [Alphaproteobacteria bacterium]